LCEDRGPAVSYTRCCKLEDFATPCAPDPGTNIRAGPHLQRLLAVTGAHHRAHFFSDGGVFTPLRINAGDFLARARREIASRLIRDVMVSEGLTTERATAGFGADPMA